MLFEHVSSMRSGTGKKKGIEETSIAERRGRIAKSSFVIA